MVITPHAFMQTIFNWQHRVSRQIWGLGQSCQLHQSLVAVARAHTPRFWAWVNREIVGCVSRFRARREIETHTTCREAYNAR